MICLSLKLSESFAIKYLLRDLQAVCEEAFRDISWFYIFFDSIDN